MDEDEQNFNNEEKFSSNDTRQEPVLEDKAYEKKRKRKVSFEDNNANTLNWWENTNVGTSIDMISDLSSSSSLDLGENSENPDNLQEQIDQREKEEENIRPSFLVPQEVTNLAEIEEPELDLGEDSSENSAKSSESSDEPELDLGEPTDSESSSFKKNQKDKNKKNILLFKKQERQKEFDTKPVKVKARRLSCSDDDGLNEYMPNGDPLVNLERKSPLIWTYGVLVMSFIIFIIEFIQEGGIEKIAINPVIGPSEETVTILGGKNAYNIVQGDFWRYLTANFITLNLLQFILSIFLVFSCRKVEADSGFWRTLFVFLLCGIYGFVLSTMAVPWVISGGLSGAFFGYIGLILCDVLSTWRMEKKNSRFTLYMILIMAFLHLIYGFTPYLDNFPHYGGFVMGFFTALMVLPNLNFDSWEKKCHGISAFLAFPIVSVLFTITLVFVYRGSTTSKYLCMWCRHLTCINFGGWCPDIETGDQHIYHVE